MENNVEAKRLYRQVYGLYDDDTIRVYQAYRAGIAKKAISEQKFVSPFKMDRMTWIKPSFLWMMYRAGWAKKEGQEYILAVDIAREGFEWALQNACLSHYDAKLHGSLESWEARKAGSCVRIQWDPERDLQMEKMDFRSIQIGLSGMAVELYVNEWVQKITDISNEVREIHQLVQNGELEQAQLLLPTERQYPLGSELINTSGASCNEQEA